MNYWVVKGRPAENDFESWLRPKRRDRWRTASPPSTWAPGDRLFFWKSAPELCVVGLGELVAPGRRQPRGVDTWFSVQYLSPSLSRPVGIAALRSDRVVRSASFLKAGPAGTVFPLTSVQGRRLFALVRRHNHFVADVWADLSDPAPVVTDVDLLEEGQEGSRRLVQHMRVERDRRLVEAKKREATHSGSLACEVCGFDFAETYGTLGRGFCEVHHRSSLARSGPTRTNLRDLAVVCSNCHRMLHRRGTVVSIKALKKALRHEA
jgi:5-methylcytosine-specific restriction endonuclease McrA